MSGDTTAFLAGCAITGVAAVLLLRGGLISEQSRVPSIQTPPATSLQQVPPSSLSAPGVPLTSDQQWQLERELDQQKTLTADLKNQLELQKTTTNDLKTSLEQQRNDTETIITQLQQKVETQQRILDTIAVQQQISAADVARSSDNRLTLSEQLQLANLPQQQPVRFQNTLLWVVGVTLIVLALGGGVILVILIVLLVQSQRRYPRPMHVIHPMPPPYVLPEQALLPSQTRSPRRTSQIEIYED